MARPPCLLPSATKRESLRADWRGCARAVGARPRCQIEECLVTMETAIELVNHQREKALKAPIRSGNMRGEEDIWHVFDRAVGRDRLGVEDVEARDDIAAPQALD